MKTLNILAIALIVAGSSGLAYGSFGFTKETQEARIGPLAVTVQERETVKIPQWAGIAAILAGALLFIVPKTS